jgi:hypothetical protein
MMSWLNPFKWWSLLQEKRKWKDANWHFVDACQHQDVTRALNAVELMVQISRRADNRRLLLDSYHNLNICQQFISKFELPDEWIVYMNELQVTLDRELMERPERGKWWM